MDQRVTLTLQPLHPLWTNSGVTPQANADYSSWEWSMTHMKQTVAISLPLAEYILHLISYYCWHFEFLNSYMICWARPFSSISTALKHVSLDIFLAMTDYVNDDSG